MCLVWAVFFTQFRLDFWALLEEGRWVTKICMASRFLRGTIVISRYCKFKKLSRQNVVEQKQKQQQNNRDLNVQYRHFAPFETWDKYKICNTKNYSVILMSVPGTLSWEVCPTQGWQPRALGHTTAVVGDTLYVFGGIYRGEAKNTLYMLNIGEYMWLSSEKIHVHLGLIYKKMVCIICR